MTAGPASTSPSLMAALAAGPANHSAWSEFVRLYSPHVLRWCRRQGLQESDAADVAQDVMLRVWRKAEEFRYDPSRTFRGYLRRVVRGAVSDWADRRRADPLGTGDETVQDRLWSEPAREDLLARIESAYDTELLAIAMREVEGRVQPHTWQAFRMLAIDGLSGSDVATALSMEVNTTYVARAKVQRMIREVIARLDSSAGS